MMIVLLSEAVGAMLYKVLLLRAVGAVNKSRSFRCRFSGVVVFRFDFVDRLLEHLFDTAFFDAVLVNGDHLVAPGASVSGSLLRVSNGDISPSAIGNTPVDMIHARGVRVFVARLGASFLGNLLLVSLSHSPAVRLDTHRLIVGMACVAAGPTPMPLVLVATGTTRGASAAFGNHFQLPLYRTSSDAPVNERIEARALLDQHQLVHVESIVIFSIK